MNTKIKTIVVEYPPENIRLVISESTAQIGFYRTVLSDDAKSIEMAKDPEEFPLEDVRNLATRILHTVLYPAMIASVVEAEGFDHWPITFEEFQNIPEPLEVKWETATYDLNPHWKARAIPPEELEKKVTKST